MRTIGHVAQSKEPSVSKDHLAHWKKSIFLQGSSANYFVELQHRGRRRKLSLSTSNIEAAASRARDMYRLLKANGWEAVDAKFRSPMGGKTTDCTLGDYIARAQATADIKPRTLEVYSRSVRKIASDLLKLANDNSRYDYRKGGRAAWLEKVDTLKLSWLTPNRIAAWKKDFLSRAEQDPVSQRRARISANHFLRSGRSLFSAKIRRHIDLPFPDPLPFNGIEFDPKPDMKFFSTFDLGEIIQAAREELADSDPEAFKVLLLSGMAGLRRKEIDLLPWSAFRWNEGVIRVEHTRFFNPKRPDSAADVAIDPELLALFRGYRARSRSEDFVIESSLEPRMDVIYNHYRCEELFRRLSGWLREHGIKSAKPIHELRKAFGSAICQWAGIHQASRSLRHSDIRVTSAVYVDSKSRVSVGLGYLIAPSTNVARLTATRGNTNEHRTHPSHRRRQIRPRSQSQTSQVIAFLKTDVKETSPPS